MSESFENTQNVECFSAKTLCFRKHLNVHISFKKRYTLLKNVSPFNRVLLISSCSSDRFSDPAPNRVFCDIFLFVCYEFGPRSSPGSRQYALVKGKEGRCYKVYSKKIQCECMICNVYLEKIICKGHNFNISNFKINDVP